MRLGMDCDEDESRIYSLQSCSSSAREGSERKKGSTHVDLRVELAEDLLPLKLLRCETVSSSFQVEGNRTDQP